MKPENIQQCLVNPFHLISWWDMNTFGAHLFVNIGASLTYIGEQWNEFLKEATVTAVGTEKAIEYRLNIADMMRRLAKELSEIGCHVAASAATRLGSSCSYVTSLPSADAFKARTDELRNIIFDEMKSQKFFWMPISRVSWHEKTGRNLLGDECADRFIKSGIENEMERAAKCFAFGQYTACVFHLMRICEAGVRALAKATGYDWDQCPNWGKFYKQYDVQLATNPTKHVEPWLSHADFLESVGGNLRAVKDAWRNNTMHLEKTYDEEQSHHLLTVVPSFMKQLSSQVDEDGNFV
jgi:hypothetical protein